MFHLVANNCLGTAQAKQSYAAAPVGLHSKTSTPGCDGMNDVCTARAATKLPAVTAGVPTRADGKPSKPICVALPVPAQDGPSTTTADG